MFSVRLRVEAGETDVELIIQYVAQAVSGRPLTAVARVPSHNSPCDVFIGQTGTGTGLSLSTSVFPCQHRSTNAPYSSSCTRCS